MPWGDVVCLEVGVMIVDQGATALPLFLLLPTCAASSIQGVGDRPTCSQGHSA